MDDGQKMMAAAGLAAVGVVFFLVKICGSSKPAAEEDGKKKKDGKKKTKKKKKTSSKKTSKKEEGTDTPAAPKQKTSKKEEKAPKKEAKKEAPKKKKSGGAKKKQPKKEVKVASDNDDDESAEAFFFPKKEEPKAASSSKNHKKYYEDEYEEEEGDYGMPASWGGAGDSAPSKSALRRRRAKAKDKGAPSSSSSSASAKGKQVDADGFETVLVKKRRAKKRAPAPEEEKKESAVSSSYSEEVDVNMKFGIIIGPGGATMKKIQEACLVRIDVPDRESGKRTVTVTGDPGAVANAKSQLASLVSKGYCAATDPAMSSASLAVEPRMIGVVIGPGGANIKALQEAFGVKINTPDRNAEATRVSVHGDKDAVKAAKEALKSLVTHGFCSVTHPGWTSQEVEFPADEFRTLIGPGGQTIKSIQGDTKTKVNLPDSSNPNQHVVVVGPKEGVARAAKQISGLLAKRDAAEEAARFRAAQYSDDDAQYDDEYYNQE